MSRTIKLTIEYDGTDYCGWQLQSNQQSVQGRIEAALAQIFQTAVRVHGSGRTDAGVHARGQIASVVLPREFAPDDLKRALNALLPYDIAVTAAERVPENFNPRRDALSRVYEYRLLNRLARSPLEHRYAWHVPAPLDFAAMRSAAAIFVGEHDFTALRSLGSDERTTIRRVFVSDWRRQEEIFIYRVEATSFMRHMVRTMVTMMVDAGRGVLDNERIVAIVASRDRALAPAPAPAAGLYLIDVRYGNRS